MNALLIKIGEYEFTEVWDGVLYKKLSRYPLVSDWEMRTLVEFIEYEERNGRECRLECENTALLELVRAKLKHKDVYRNVERPALITECTACPKRKGCTTQYVCHTTSIENAALILQSGKLLSAFKARNLPVEELMRESRNAANDPADYFEYIMFAWGNCQAGDRLVMERKLGRFPTEDDLSTHFTPGVRFFFRYDTLAKHPRATFDGVLPLKIKDELFLENWVFRIVIPENERETLTPFIPSTLQDRVLYLHNDCTDVWEWAEKVYCAIEAAGS